MNRTTQNLSVRTHHTQINKYNINITQNFYVLTNHTKDKHTCINEQYTTSVQHKISMF